MTPAERLAIRMCAREAFCAAKYRCHDGWGLRTDLMLMVDAVVAYRAADRYTGAKDPSHTYASTA